jgi:hypothetical protein
MMLVKQIQVLQLVAVLVVQTPSGAWQADQLDMLRKLQ